MSKNRNRPARNRTRKIAPTYPVMTLDEVRAAGYSASFCRTLSRTFERVARKGYGDSSSYDYRSAMNASYQFRQYAKEV